MPSSLREIRQQLDDLNALMGRLMAVPVVPDAGVEVPVATDADDPIAVHVFGDAPTVSDALIVTPPPPKIALPDSSPGAAIAAILGRHRQSPEPYQSPSRKFLARINPVELETGLRGRLMSLPNAGFDWLCQRLGPVGRLLGSRRSTWLLESPRPPHARGRAGVGARDPLRTRLARMGRIRKVVAVPDEPPRPDRKI